MAAPAPPSLSKTPVVSGILKSGQTTKTTTGTWTSPDKLVYTYQWERCDSSGLNCTLIANATTGTYKLTTADIGHDIIVLVIATDLEGQSSPATQGPVGPVN